MCTKVLLNNTCSQWANLDLIYKCNLNLKVIRKPYLPRGEIQQKGKKMDREVSVSVSTFLYPWTLHRGGNKATQTVHLKMSQNSSTTDNFWTFLLGDNFSWMFIKNNWFFALPTVYEVKKMFRCSNYWLQMFTWGREQITTFNC